MSLEKMLRSILERFPQIGQLRFIIYEPFGQYDSYESVSEPEFVNIARAEMLRSRFSLREIARRCVPDITHALGITSHLETTEGWRHLFLMDLSVSKELSSLPRSLNAIQSCVRCLGQEEGFLLETNHSFHFYGMGALLQEMEWRRMLTQAKTFLREIEDGYIKCSLGRGYGVLRLSASATKPGIPRVMWRFDRPG